MSEHPKHAAAAQNTGEADGIAVGDCNGDGDGVHDADAPRVSAAVPDGVGVAITPAHEPGGTHRMHAPEGSTAAQSAKPPLFTFGDVLWMHTPHPSQCAHVIEFP